MFFFLLLHWLPVADLGFWELENEKRAPARSGKLSWQLKISRLSSTDDVLYCSQARVTHQQSIDVDRGEAACPQPLWQLGTIHSTGNSHKNTYDLPQNTVPTISTSISWYTYTSYTVQPLLCVVSQPKIKRLLHRRRFTNPPSGWTPYLSSFTLIFTAHYTTYNTWIHPFTHCTHTGITRQNSCWKHANNTIWQYFE